MWKKLAAMAMAMTSSLFGGLQDDIDRAIGIVHEFESATPQMIPKEVLNQAKGLVIVGIVKAAFLASGAGGYGIVLGKTSTGSWTAPSAIGIGGAGLGLQVGAEATDLILVLNNEKALDKFKNTKASLSSDVSLTAGPVGETFESGELLPKADIYSYSISEGLFAGISLEGTLFIERKKANEKFYGKPVTANELLSGKISRPPGAKALYRELSLYQ